MKNIFNLALPIFLLMSSTSCLSEVVKLNETDLSVEKINLYLNNAFRKKSNGSYALRIQSALRVATSNREKADNSTNVVLRNAEYYLHGLYATASGDIEHTKYTVGVTAYVALKYAAYAAKGMGIDWFEKILRVDKNKQTSEPGGVFWAYSGLCDGLKIDGKEEIEKSKSHPIELFSCGEEKSPVVSPPKSPSVHLD